MNNKLKYDHFENTEEVLRHIALWYREDDIEYPRWFGLDDLNKLRIYIEQLQSNWNSLREWLERMIQRFIDIDNLDYVTFQVVRDKMNELEKSDSNN